MKRNALYWEAFWSLVGGVVPFFNLTVLPLVYLLPGFDVWLTTVGVLYFNVFGVPLLVWIWLLIVAGSERYSEWSLGELIKVGKSLALYGNLFGLLYVTGRWFVGWIVMVSIVLLPNKD